MRSWVSCFMYRLVQAFRRRRIYSTLLSLSRVTLWLYFSMYGLELCEVSHLFYTVVVIVRFSFVSSMILGVGVADRFYVVVALWVLHQRTCTCVGAGGGSMGSIANGRRAAVWITALT